MYLRMGVVQVGVDVISGIYGEWGVVVSFDKQVMKCISVVLKEIYHRKSVKPKQSHLKLKKRIS